MWIGGNSIPTRTKTNSNKPTAAITDISVSEKQDERSNWKSDRGIEAGDKTTWEMERQATDEGTRRKSETRSSSPCLGSIGGALKPYQWPSNSSKKLLVR